MLWPSSRLLRSSRPAYKTPAESTRTGVYGAAAITCSAGLVVRNLDAPQTWDDDSLWEDLRPYGNDSQGPELRVPPEAAAAHGCPRRHPALPAKRWQPSRPGTCAVHPCTHREDR